ncbi:MAG: alpha-xylosidase, partial [Pseudopedobacter saltans]
MAQGHYQSKANPLAVLNPEKNIRFTVLSPNLIRMEWDSTGHFTDLPSFTVVNRKMKVPHFTKTIKDRKFIVTTDALRLEYVMGTGKFSSTNLHVSSVGISSTILWEPGKSQTDNLKGTYRTLDEYDGDSKHGVKMPIEDGMLAKDGWTFLDDSQSLLFDSSSNPWVDKSARHSNQDWYVFIYGSDYKKALFDYASIGGNVPLPPRFAFGYWWSRYWRYSDNEFRSLLANFKRFNIPLDVLVIDMDWHKQGWTGWTWDSSLFPNPSKFLQWTNEQHLKTTLNLHPADGVGFNEEKYRQFAHAMAFDTVGHKSIPYQGSNRKFMQTLFDTVLRPFEKMGIDFWWLDWQQWLEDKDVPNLSNTWWLNYMFFTDMANKGTSRPMLYHRWGGLGNHRYQIGFSGDAIISWKSLAFQPYFTSTASNVLYDYWSHDIGGHTITRDFKGLDPELYARWMQFGALSPIFRTHSTKNGLLNKELWEFRGKYYDAIYDAVKLRYRLAPYIYTMARKTYDSAIAICRPMYYDYPTDSNAYQFKDQYAFGDDILVAPITEPSTNGISTKRIWLPPNDNWYEWNTGTLLKGGQIVDRKFSLDEYPIYVKAGAIIPMNSDSVQNLDGQPSTISLGVFPGMQNPSVGNLYEDPGNNKNYVNDNSTTSYRTSLDAQNNISFVINPVKGNFKGMQLKRKYIVRFYGKSIPSSVWVNGKNVLYDNASAGAHWKFDGNDM